LTRSDWGFGSLISLWFRNVLICFFESFVWLRFVLRIYFNGATWVVQMRYSGLYPFSILNIGLYQTYWALLNEFLFADIA